VLGIPLLIALFVFLSNLLLQRSQSAALVLGFVPLYLALLRSERHRNEQLALIFAWKELRLLRLVENVIITMPFSLILVFNGTWHLGLGLLIIAGLLSLISLQPLISANLPTPFSSRPFEFARGFRMTIPLNIIVWILVVLAIWSENGNIGFLAILMAVLGMMFNYAKLEPEMFVWNFKGSFRSFIWSKSKTLLLFGTFTLLPIVVLLSIFYSDLAFYFFLGIPISWLYLFMALLAKYSCFPKPMNLLYEIIYSIGILIPFVTPFLLVLFWRRAQSHLKTVLT
jgi:hypothetical protein